MLIDSHAHITSPEFDTDRDAVLQRATDANITKIIEVGFNMASSKLAVAFSHTSSMVYHAVGIQPFYATKPDAQQLEVLAELITDTTVAIGEIGLDFHYDVCPKAQEKLFLKQLELARVTNLPVILHLRDADEQMCALIQAGILDGLRGVLHCFSGGHALAEAALGKGFYISLPGTVTFKNYKNNLVVQAIPDDRLLVETDAPYLAPVPQRGKRNEPSFITNTVTQIAQIRNQTPDHIATITTQNAHQLFFSHEV